MKQFLFSLVFLVVGAVGGYLYGRQYGNIQAFEIGYNLGYHTGASDAQLPKDNDTPILIQQLQGGVGDLQLRVGKLEDK